MRARRLGASIGILGILLGAPSGAAAAPPITTITIEVVFDVSETFIATGGVVCASGTAVTDPVFGTFGGRQNRGVFTFHLVKTLTCADDSGTFTLLVNASTSPNSPGTVGGFAAGGGSGAYADLHGGGHLVGTAYPDGSGLTDVYTGRLHLAP